MEQQLAKMERREKGLIAKVELQEGRIHQTAPKFGDKPARGGASDISPAEQLKMLKNKRERLEHTIERLSLQTTHKVQPNLEITYSTLLNTGVDFRNGSCA